MDSCDNTNTHIRSQSIFGTTLIEDVHYRNWEPADELPSTPKTSQSKETKNKTDHPQQLSEKEFRFLKTTFFNKNLPSGEYVKLSGIAKNTAGKIRKRLVALGYLQEKKVDLKGTRGNAPKLLIPTAKGIVLIKSDNHPEQINAEDIKKEFQNPSQIHQFPNDVLQTVFEINGWNVKKEDSINVNGEELFGDLVARKDSRSILVEIENEPRRLYQDFLKGTRFDCTWIISPNKIIATAIRRKMDRLQVVERQPWLAVYTLPQAIHQIESLDLLFSTTP